MATDYGTFEKKYQQLKTEGTAWNSSSQLTDTLADFARFLALPGVPRSGRALELGCGSGDFSLWLAERGFEISGVDISPTAVQWAREKFAARGLPADFRVASVLDLTGFADDSFDLVLDGHCFHCIIGKDRETFLSNVHRVLKPQGVFHVATMCGEIHDPAIRASFDPETQCVMRNGIAVRQVKMPGELLRELETAEFRVLHWEVDPPKTYDDQDDLLANATKQAK